MRKRGGTTALGARRSDERLLVRAHQAHRDVGAGESVRDSRHVGDRAADARAEAQGGLEVEAPGRCFRPSGGRRAASRGAGRAARRRRGRPHRPPGLRRPGARTCARCRTPSGEAGSPATCRSRSRARHEESEHDQVVLEEDELASRSADHDPRRATPPEGCRAPRAAGRPGPRRRRRARSGRGRRPALPGTAGWGRERGPEPCRGWTYALERPDYHADDLISCRVVSSPVMRAFHDSPVRRLSQALGLLLALLFLLANLAARAHALHAAGATRLGRLPPGRRFSPPRSTLARPSLLAPALALFGASFFLYGFHAYRLPSQAFELLVTAARPRPAAPTAPAGSDPVDGRRRPRPAALRRVRARGDRSRCCSCPPRCSSTASSSRGTGFAHAILGAFPKDPLYPIASVNRLWLFVLFAALLSSQPDARAPLPGPLPGDRLGGPGGRRPGAPGLPGRPLARALQPLAPLLRRAVPAPAVHLRQPELVRLLREPGAALRPARAVGGPEAEARGDRLSSPAVRGEPLSLGRPGLVARGSRPDRLSRRSRPAVAAPPPPAPVPGSRSSGWLSAPRSPRSRCSSRPRSSPRPRPFDDAGRPRPARGSLARGADPGPGPHVAAPRGGPVRDRARPARSPSWASGTRASTCTCGPSSTSRPRRSRASSTRPSRQDASEPLFDDSHNTYLQVLAGTGAVGLGLWLALAAAGLLAAARALRRDGGPVASRSCSPSSSSTSTASSRAWRTSRSSSSSSRR